MYFWGNYLVLWVIYRNFAAEKNIIVNETSV